MAWLSARCTSIAPAAPSMWPVMDLVDETGTRLAASSPRASLMAAVSAASLSGVEVPWALMYATAEGGSPASPRAHLMARPAPAPVG